MTKLAIAAAVMTDDGVIHFMPPPNRHHHTVHALHRGSSGGEGLVVARGEQGFVMSDGTFASRHQAGIFAREAGQIAELKWPPLLYSEDLW